MDKRRIAILLAEKAKHGSITPKLIPSYLGQSMPKFNGFTMNENTLHVNIPQLPKFQKLFKSIKVK